MQDPLTEIPYRRARFSTRLPVGRLYTPSHFWLLEEEPGLWRVGFTRFATRMLGELVEFEFQLPPGEMASVGQVIGFVEGFKAVTDLFSIVDGEFIEHNRELDNDITLTDTDPYGAGWLYRIRGTPVHTSVDVYGYIRLLDATVDRMRDEAHPA